MDGVCLYLNLFRDIEKLDELLIISCTRCSEEACIHVCTSGGDLCNTEVDVSSNIGTCAIISKGIYLYYCLTF